MGEDAIFGIKSPLGKVGWQKFWLFKGNPDIGNEERRSLLISIVRFSTRSVDASVLMRSKAIVARMERFSN